MTSSIDGRTVLVTGANGGLGTEFVRQALDRGARTVYAAARTPRQWDDSRVRTLALDITDQASVDAAVSAASDVDLLINNAAIAPAGDIISGPEQELRRIFETNFFGTLRVANAFAPILGANGGGTVLNILSAASWINIPTGYAASKAAAWSATKSLGVVLAPQGTQVIGLQVGMIDTAMTIQYDVQKATVESVVAQAYDGVSAGLVEILADDSTREVKARLSSPAEEFYPWLDEQLAGLLT